jgi:hypothetical protein
VDFVGLIFYMENLEWFPVKGYEGLYEITKCGKVKSLDKIRIGVQTRYYKGKNIAIVKTGDSYLSVVLYKDGAKKMWLLHRLVATTFLENEYDKKYVNHKDKNKHNNCVDNLEWVSAIENNCHMQQHRNNTSDYPGVYLHIDKKKYKSQINHNGKRFYLGTFDTEQEAYAARCKYEKDNGIINKYL